ncbi:MAG: hypothetical protein KIS92_18735, partial [Planctomycetota bacterium]|nr:hypothetical protein [Planctomycetota bacterium]
CAFWTVLYEFLYRPLNIWQQSWHLPIFAFLSGALFVFPEFKLRNARHFALAAGVACGLVRVLVQLLAWALNLQELYGADHVILGAALGYCAGLSTRYPLAAQWGLAAGALGGLVGSIPDVWLSTGFAKIGSKMSDSGMPFWLSPIKTFFVSSASFLPIAFAAGVAIYYAFEFKKVNEEDPLGDSVHGEKKAGATSH